MATDSAEMPVAQATILFADIIGSLELANYLDVSAYDHVLNEWYKVASRAVALWSESGLGSSRSTNISIRGDELCVILSSGDVREDILGALTIAGDVKVGWLLSDCNARRRREGKPPVEIGAGIHTGEVVRARRAAIYYEGTGEVYLPEQLVLEGYNISVAKRVEAASRNGKHTKLMLTHTVQMHLDEMDIAVQCEAHGRWQLPGLAQGFPLYEVKACETLGRWILERNPERWEELQACAQADPENLSLHAAMAEIYRAQGDVARARETARLLLREEGDLVPAQLTLGWALRRSGQPKEALRHVDHALAVAPGSVLARVDRALCLLDLGRIEEAEAEAQAALARRPEWPETQYARGRVCAAQGREEEARECLARVKERGGEGWLGEAEEGGG